MITSMFYTSARESIKEFINGEFRTLGSSDVDKLINSFYKMLNYEEEGLKVRPSLLVTSNISAVQKAIPDCVRIPFYDDENSNNFNQRLKALTCFCLNDWKVYINFGNDGVEYGLIRTLNSIKDQAFEKQLFTAENREALASKTKLIMVSVVGAGVITLTGIKGNEISVCFNLNQNIHNDWEETIQRFVNDSLSKLKTTKRKLQDIKNLYENIFQKGFKSLHGALCLIIDKDYVDKGLLSDGTWLAEPIEFGKLFLRSKNFSESKLRGYADLFLTMLNYDGITVIDNAGRIRAYNVFVENSKSVTQNVVGGARLRAAYTMLNTTNKKIIGVYFQSQDGDVFYKSTKEARSELASAVKVVAAKNNFKQMEMSITDTK